MIGRVLLAALLAGLAAGLIMAVVQHVRLTPLIVQAETFEVEHSHSASEQAEQHDHDEGTWAPADGVERTLFTTLTAVVSACGFGAMLAGVSFLAGLPITKSNGWIWGACGFLAFSMAPSLGLPPELPGMPSVDVTTRQVWWTATVILTGAGLWRLATAPSWITALIGLAALAAPHFFTPARPGDAASQVPAMLAAEFATSSLAANCIMWLALGTTLGFALNQFREDALP